MKKNTILFATLFAGLLAGTAGNTQDTSKCKVLDVKKNSLYAIDVIYKDCKTGQRKTQRMALANDERTLLLDPSIDSDKDLRVVGVGLTSEYLWAANKAGNRWTVSCGGSVLEPDCEGTATNPVNCKTVNVVNDAWFTIKFNYAPCGSTNPGGVAILEKNDRRTFSVEPKTSVIVREVPSGYQYLDAVIPGDTTVHCTGSLFNPSCIMGNAQGSPRGTQGARPTAPGKKPASPHGKPTEKAK